MRCQEFREMMDSYLNDELLVETNHEVLRHLENCADCRNEFAARRRLLTQMRSAVKGAPEMQINPTFAIGMRNDLRETALRPAIWKKLKNGVFANSPIFAAAVAACLLIGILFGATWLQHSPAPENTVARENQTENPAETLSQTDSIAAQIVQTVWRETTEKAVGDHKNCALHFRLAEEPITLTEAAEKYGAFNKDLDKTVIASVREVFAEKISGKTVGKIEFLEAHSCVFNNRRFAHIVLRRDKRIISVLVTDADFSDENGDRIINQQDGNFQVAQFRTARQAVFVVSDLSERENLIIAETISPAIRRHIGQSEAGA